MENLSVLKRWGSIRRLRGYAVAALLVMLSVVWVPQAQATDSGDVAAATSGELSSLGACISEKDSLDVVLLIDETESLVHEVRDGEIHKDKPGSDAANNRIPAAQSFIDELARKQEQLGFSADVRVAGFGEEYRSGDTNPDEYGEWIALNSDSVPEAKGQIDKFTDRVTEEYTNHANALEGATADLLRHGADSCRMIVTFTDGALTSEQGADVAQEKLCGPAGVVDDLRRAHITNVGIGLSNKDNPSDFSLFKGVTEGTAAGEEPCGTVPGDGAFFEASDVGDLFVAFRQALSTGGEFSQDLKAGESFEFWLDNSIDEAVVTAIARDKIADSAVLELTSPDGEKIQLRDSGAKGIAGAKVEWTAKTDPVQQGDATLHKTADKGWAGLWKAAYVGLPAQDRDKTIFNSVQMQPGIHVQFSGKDEQGQVNLRDNQELKVELVDRDGHVRKLAGTATTDAEFITGDDAKQTLATGVDIAQGQAGIALSGLESLPAIGRAQTTTRIVTAGPDGAPGTALTPISDGVSLSVAKQNLPQLSSVSGLNMEEPQTTVEFTAEGPGKLWIEPGSVVAASSLPEGLTELGVSSEHDSEANALVLEPGQRVRVPVTISATDMLDGTIEGEIPVQVSDITGAEKQEVSVPIEGTMATPLNTKTFTAVLILVLLASILIPLGILYLVRYLTAKIPQQPLMGVIKNRVRTDGSLCTFDGAPTPQLDETEAVRNQVHHDGRSFVAAGYPLKVKSWQLNPFARPFAMVQGSAEKDASISGESAQTKQKQAKLPLAVQNKWFIAEAPDEPGAYDLVIIPIIPLTQAMKSELQREIAGSARELVARLADEAAKRETQEAFKQDKKPQQPVAPTPQAAPKDPYDFSFDTDFDFGVEKPGNSQEKFGGGYDIDSGSDFGDFGDFDGFDPFPK